MNAISIKSKFLANNKVSQQEYFPFEVRASAIQRIKRHSFYFGGLNAVFSIGYHLMTLKWGFALRKAANSFLHKGAIGLVFFYTNEVLWGWLHSQKQLKKDNDEKIRISSWSTYFLSSVILLPVFIGINLIYKHPARKTLMRSVVDALLLTSFGLISEKMIRKNRKVLIDGELKNKQALLNLNQ